MGNLSVPHLIILNKNPISEESLGPALTYVYTTLWGTQLSWAQRLLWPQCRSAPDGVSRAAMCQLTRWEMNANGFSTLPAATAPTSCPSSSPCKRKRWISAMVLTSCLSDLERSVCSGKAWCCANDAEPESKRGWKGGPCDLGLRYSPSSSPSVLLWEPGHLGLPGAWPQAWVLLFKKAAGSVIIKIRLRGIS